jgi:hypothetical protein
MKTSDRDRCDPLASAGARIVIKLHMLETATNVTGEPALGIAVAADNLTYGHRREASADEINCPH